MKTPKYEIEELSLDTIEWFVETAAVNMIKDEFQKPELVNIPHFYLLSMHAIENNSGWVVRQDGKLIGALGALVAPNIFNPEYKTLTEMFWYVLPEHRNTRAGLLLLNAFDKKGEEYYDSTLSLLPTSFVSIKTFNRRGFKLSEYGFRKEYK